MINKMSRMKQASFFFLLTSFKRRERGWHHLERDSSRVPRRGGQADDEDGPLGIGWNKKKNKRMQLPGHEAF